MLNNVKVLYVLDFVAFKNFHVQHPGSSRGLTPPAIGGPGVSEKRMRGKDS